MTRRTLVAAVIALALHGGALLWRAPPEAPPRTLLPRSVHVRIVEQKPKPAVSQATGGAPSAPARPPAVPAKASVKAPKRHNSVAKPQPERPGRYEDLLPGADWQPGVAPAAGQPGAVPTTAARISSEEVLGKLDIPLVAREAGGNVKALAKLVRVSTNPAGFTFESVDGDPLLRAVLYEALRAPANRRIVLDLFLQLGDREILISLRQHTITTDLASEKYAESATIQGNKLVVDRTLYIGPSGGGGGLVLPDEEAKRAVRRDRAARDRLELSPAFKSPIRDRDP